ncbi:MAG: transposase, partial [Euryarchaeota archaeon]|nr:transposase [Euryarchaeota archaeon]
LQNFIKYKALWEGAKIIEVNPKGTSQRCTICGSNLEYSNVHLASCPKCGLIDRQLNAAINLLKTQDEGVRFAPDSWANAVLKRNGGSMNSNPPSLSPEVTLSLEQGLGR